MAKADFREVLKGALPDAKEHFCVGSSCPLYAVVEE
jgi:hypothetical protein